MLNHGINAINKNYELLPGSFNSSRKAAAAATRQADALSLSGDGACFLQPLLFNSATHADFRGS